MAFFTDFCLGGTNPDDTSSSEDEKLTYNPSTGLVRTPTGLYWTGLPVEKKAKNSSDDESSDDDDYQRYTLLQDYESYFPEYNTRETFVPIWVPKHAKLPRKKPYTQRSGAIPSVYSAYFDKKMPKTFENLPVELYSNHAILKLLPRALDPDNSFIRAVKIGAYLTSSSPHPAPKASKKSYFYNCWRKIMPDNQIKIPANIEQQEIGASKSAHHVEVEDIHYFEEANPKYFVGVLGYRDKCFYPIRSFKSVGETRKGDDVTVVWLFLDDKYYFPVTSMDALFKGKVAYPCSLCLAPNTDEEERSTHVHVCSRNGVEEGE